MVYVFDKRKQPLMPCSQKNALGSSLSGGAPHYECSETGMVILA